MDTVDYVNMLNLNALGFFFTSLKKKIPNIKVKLDSEEGC